MGYPMGDTGIVGTRVYGIWRPLESLTPQYFYPDEQLSQGVSSFFGEIPVNQSLHVLAGCFGDIGDESSVLSGSRHCMQVKIPPIL